MTLSIDSETENFSQGNLAPKLACVSYCGEDFVPGILHHTESEGFLYDALTTKHTTYHNCGYDLAVFMRNFPRLTGAIFDALRDDRVEDTKLRARLVDLAHGELGAGRRSYSLAAVHERYGFGELEKPALRTEYGELIDVPLKQWETRKPGSVSYALKDAEATQRIYGAQLQWQDLLEDSCRQARAAFALHLQSVHGMVTDRRKCQEFVDAVKLEIRKAGQIIERAGLVVDGKRKTKPAKRLMLQACADLVGSPATPEQLEAGLSFEFEKYQRPPATVEVLGVPVPVTAKGQVRVDAEACEDTGNEVLQAYTLFTSSNTQFKKAELLFHGSDGKPLQTSYESLLETGRTSSRAPGAGMYGDNFQNLRATGYGPNKIDIRSCFVPRPGFALVSIDYNSAELVSWSQVCLWLFGKSRMAEVLIAQEDPHCMVAAQLLGCSYEEAVANKKQDRYKRARDLGKIVNFGLSGGMGPKKFAMSTNKKIKNKADKISEAFARDLIVTWKKTWPEADAYLGWVKDTLGEGRISTIKQFKSNRIRAHLDYSTTANTLFQGLTADAAKAALLPLARECYVEQDSPLFGSRVLLHVHDENLLEAPLSNLHAAAFRARDIMVDTYREWVPDVPVHAEPAAMLAWYKRAETVLGPDGKLAVWQPA